MVGTARCAVRVSGWRTEWPFADTAARRPYHRQRFVDRRSLDSFALSAIIFDQTVHQTIDVLPINARTFDAVDRPRSFVISRLNACEDFAVVHDVRLEVNHRTQVEPGRDQIARVDVTACADFG